MTTVPLVEAAFDIDTPHDYERLTNSHPSVLEIGRNASGASIDVE